MAWFVCTKCKIVFNVKVTRRMRQLVRLLNGGKVIPDCPNCLSNAHVKRAPRK